MKAARATGRQKKKASGKGPRTSVQVVDLFSGCGGMSYGFSRARKGSVRFDVLGGLDCDPHANATYERMIGKPALHNDIRNLPKRSALAAAKKAWGRDDSKPLILIGCAPCQGFSSHRKKDKRADPRNELLEAFAKVALAMTPDLIVMENVPEMLHEDHWEHFVAFRDALASKGYAVRARIYNLASFGVPQERFRALVLCSRDKSKLLMPQPVVRPRDFVTVRTAIGHLPKLRAGASCPTDPMHVTSKHRKETVELLSLIPKDGGSRRSLPKGVGPECHRRVDGFRDVYGRLWWDRPAVAITARCRTPSCGRFVHPTQNRGLSVREAALLQGFPADYHFEGPFDDKFKQIGNAVSPLFSACLANHLANVFAGRAARVSDEHLDIVAPVRKSISSALAGMKRRMRDPEFVDAFL